MVIALPRVLISLLISTHEPLSIGFRMSLPMPISVSPSWVHAYLLVGFRVGKLWLCPYI